MKEVRFIADIGSNHDQSIQKCYRLIHQAKDIGCWGVKFQLFHHKKLFAPGFKNEIERMKQWELPEEFIPKIAEYCESINIKFICTPFDLDAVDVLRPYVDYFKIGSYELLWLDLIKKVAMAGKPWMISCGMTDKSTLLEIRNAERITREINPPVTIFHCNSNYPADPKDCDLTMIRRLGNYFGSEIGWSDHSKEPGVIHKAIALGAKVIEFHFGNGPESKIGHCWGMEMGKVIHDVRIGEIASRTAESESEVQDILGFDEEAKKWRTDPEDGHRPLKKYREDLQ